MSMQRRDFLKLLGLSTLVGGTGGGAVFNVLKPGELEASTAKFKSTSGRTWAMVVDVRKFTPDQYGKCIKACHREHNVPDFGNPKDEIKWTWTDDFEHTFPGQGHEFMDEALESLPFLLMCNHCEKPACVRVCPTQATFKRASDGIVVMDPHRCIGCRFCMAACPFGARSFNWRDPRKGGFPMVGDKPVIPNPEYPTRTKGVVEKCTFCPERLVLGKEPACVEATEGSGALVFGNLEDPHSEVREVLGTHYTIQRKPELGTNPRVFYVIGG